MKKRGSGILLHITSLPSPYGIGDLGDGSFRFVDFLAQAKQSYWQILPLNLIDPAFGSSPYHSISAFAFNTLLISPELLQQEGLLDISDLNSCPRFSSRKVNYRAVLTFKRRLFRAAFDRFKKRKSKSAFDEFCFKHSFWLEDFALFVTLKDHFKGRVWSKWPADVREREPKSLQSLRLMLADRIEFEKFLQFIFFQQWIFLRKYCGQKGIQIFGDMPIYVNTDSADLWTHPELFKLDRRKVPSVVAGVPPDYFSETGQLWGNPLYRWDILKEKNFDWWILRMGHNLKLVDILRLDHFRGFVGYWEVRATEKTAAKGQWVKAPALDFFNRMRKTFPHLPIIAEDLGTITPDVRDVMKHFSFPGMKVLLFAFGEDNPMHPYLPHTYESNCVVYTGTHDNSTVRGWFETEAKPEEKRRLFRYIGKEISEQEVHWVFIRQAMKSMANTAIIPMQDILGLGNEARMNRPATTRGNWQWRLIPEQLELSLAQKLAEMTVSYGRA